MLIDLHAHAPHPGYYNQHPHWGPRFEKGVDGDIRLRVGDWLLTLGSPERRAAVRAGNPPKLEDYFARWADPKIRLGQMDGAGQDVQVVSVPSHCYMYWTEPEFSVAYARTVNNTLAEYCAGGEGRLFAWAHAPLNAPGEAAIEIRRACTELGAKGLSAGGANFGGLEFDDPAFDPVWETLCDLDLPMFIHGYNQSVTWGAKANDDKYETTAIVGMQYDETRCFWYLVCGGVFDRFPSLKVYITHGGGYVPYQLGRLNQTNKNLDVVHNKKALIEYLPNFYFDLELHEPVFRQAVLDLIGADRLLYGTNFGGSDAVRHDLTEGLRISAADLNKIRYQNALSVLHLDPAKLGRARAAA